MENNLPEINKEAFNFTQFAAPLLKEICHPLFSKLGFTVFAYIRAYFDGRMMHLSTDAKWEEIFFNHSFYNEQDCFHQLRMTTLLHGFKKFILTGEPKGAHCQALYDFDIWNTFSIYQKKEDYIEGWAFGTTRNNYSIINLYLNEYKYLNKFILYFNEKAQSLILPNEKLLIYTTKKIHTDREKNQDLLKEFMEEINLKKIPLETKNGMKFFSLREILCLKFLCEGKSFKQIADLMSISPRTVECYVNKIKQKTNINSKYQIVQKYQHYICRWF